LNFYKYYTLMIRRCYRVSVLGSAITTTPTTIWSLGFWGHRLL